MSQLYPVQPILALHYVIMGETNPSSADSEQRRIERESCTEGGIMPPEGAKKKLRQQETGKPALA